MVNICSHCCGWNFSYEMGKKEYKRTIALKENDIYFLTNILCDKNIANIDFEIDRYKFIGRNNYLNNAAGLNKKLSNDDDGIAKCTQQGKWNYK